MEQCILYAAVYAYFKVTDLEKFEWGQNCHMGQLLSPTYSHLSPTHIHISQLDQRRDMLLAAKKDDTQFSPAPRKSANTQIS